MKPNTQSIIYLVGVVVLGLLIEPVKTALGGGWVFLVVIIAYLIALRLLGGLIAKALIARKERPNA